MARILVHAMAATAGGGVTYLRNFLGCLARSDSPHEWLVLLPAELRDPPPATDRVRLVRGETGRGAARRVYYDQIKLRSLIRRERVDLILATGNFGMLRPPVPQVLLSRNALYFSPEHLTNLRRRAEMRELLNILMRRRLAVASIRDSVTNVVPTAAFGEAIRRYVPDVPSSRFAAVPHGFAHETFVRSDAGLSPAIRARLSAAPGVRRVLMVSHYNYFRNFETLLAAFGRLRRQVSEPLELVLTTVIGHGVKDHRYDTTYAAKVMHEAGVADAVTMLGTVPHGELYPLYRAADVVVCPSYAESFGHPMVEAMASGRPLVATDAPGHREVCGGAAAHFAVFDPDDLAAKLRDVLTDAALAGRLAARGLERCRDFSWDRHFADLLGVLDAAAAGGSSSAAA